MLDHNEFLEFQNIVKLIPILNNKGVEVSVGFKTKGNITFIAIDGEFFVWDNNIISQETKDRFYKKIEEILENE
jgi:hypothetical protein